MTEDSQIFTGPHEGKLKYVALNPSIDPQPYLIELDSFQDALPSGARNFASDPNHYDFYSDRCVKDFCLLEIRHESDDKNTLCRLRFRAHDDELALSYTNPTAMDMSVKGLKPNHGALGEMILDEVLPCPEGISHFMAFHQGHLSIVAEDLNATWNIAKEQASYPKADWSSPQE